MPIPTGAMPTPAGHVPTLGSGVPPAGHVPPAGSGVPPAGSGLVGRRIRLWWAGDHLFYAGHIYKFDPNRCGAHLP